MASEVYYSTNPADWVKLEGLYINRRKPPGFIAGVDLSTTMFAGLCVRGPLTPQVITSPARFLELYGGRDYGSGGAIKGEVWKALLNKNFGTIVVRRVAAAAAVAASVTLDDTAGVGGTNICTITASSVGAWGNSLTVSIEAATSGVGTQFNMRLKFAGNDTLYENLDLSGTNDNSLTVLGDDLGNLVTLTKLSAGRPHNQADTPLASGSDGTVAVADYTAAVTDLAYYQKSGVILTPEATPAQATYNATLVTLAPQVTDKLFLTWSGVPANSVSAETAAVAAQITTRHRHIVWCYNPAYTLDPTLATAVEQAPHVWMASILSQTDVDIHPGDHDNAELLAGITSLRYETLTRNDLIALRAAGISTLEKLDGEFNFRSAVTTSLTPGETELTGVRMEQFLTTSLAGGLKYHVKKRNTPERRAMIRGDIEGFLQPLKDSQRIVEDFEVITEALNTKANRGKGLERIGVRVDTVDHILHLVLDAEIGSAVVVQRQAA